MSKDLQDMKKDQTPEEKVLDQVLTALWEVFNNNCAPSELPEALRSDTRFQQLVEYLLDVQRFALAISTGDITQSLARKGFMANSLKDLQASLRQITQQTQLVAQGHLDQRIDLDRDFSAAFNTMVANLEKSLHDLEQREDVLRKYEQIVSLTPDFISLVDRGERYLMVNESYIRFTGKEEDDLIGQPITAFINAKSVEENSRPALRQALAGKTTSFDAWYEFKNNERRFYNVTYSPFYGPAGDVMGAVISARDITSLKQTQDELQESEARYRSLVELSPDAIIVRREDTVIYQNEAALKLIGAHRMEDVPHKSVLEFIHPEDREMVLQHDRELQGENQTRMLSAVRLLRLDGQEVTAEAAISPILFQGSPAMQIVLRDVTGRKQSEESLRRTNAELQHRVDELYKLNIITQAVTTLTSLEDALSTVAKEVTELFDAVSCDVSVLDAERKAHVVIASYTTEPNLPIPKGNRYTLPEVPTSAARQIVDIGKTLVVDNASTSPVTQFIRDFIVLRKIHAAMFVPLKARGEVIGTFALGVAQPGRTFTQAELSLAETVAGQIAGALYNSHLFDEARRRAEHMSLLNQFGLAVASGLDMQQVLQKLYEQCQRMAKVDYFYVALYDAESGDITYPLFMENGDQIAITPMNIHTQPGLAGQVILSRASLYLPDVLSFEQTNKDSVIHIGGRKAQSYAGVPLQLGSETIGVLSMQSYEPDAYSPEQIQLLEMMANQAAIAIANARLYTGAREAQEMAEAARRNAEAASRAKSTFLANMSHEIRTPMNAVLGFVQILQRDASITGTQREYLNSIERSGEHLLDLINDILEMSKIEAGRVQLALNDFDLQAILADLESMFRVRTDEKKLFLDIRQVGAVHPYLHGDSAKIRQVLINLLGNSLKFTEKGGITMRVFQQDQGEFMSAHPDDSSCTICIDVEDTGRGINLKDAGIIFEAFEQTRDGISRGGTGLGLPISRQYARMMDGDLFLLSSEIGKGSIFRFLFKAQQIEQASLPKKADTSADEVIGLTPGQAAPKVLVVDDVESNRLILRLLLEKIGFQVSEANDGFQAVTLAQADRPDVVLMDLRMPGLDGLEAMRAIKETPGCQGIFVIMVTASALEENRKEAMRAGVDGFVRKPYKIGEVLSEIKRVLKVQYTYANSVPGSTQTLSEPVSTAGLPPELVQQLITLTEQGYLNKLEKLLDGSVKDTNPALAHQLKTLAGKYDVEKIISLLKSEAQG